MNVKLFVVKKAKGLNSEKMVSNDEGQDFGILKVKEGDGEWYDGQRREDWVGELWGKGKDDDGEWWADVGRIDEEASGETGRQGAPDSGGELWRVWGEGWCDEGGIEWDVEGTVVMSEVRKGTVMLWEV